MSKLINIVFSALISMMLLYSLNNVVVVMSNQQAVVTDALQRSVNITVPPGKIVSLAPFITETLAYLGVDDHIVAADSLSFDSWYMNIGVKLKERGVKSVGGYWWSTVNIDEILALQPDLVLADAGAHKPLLSTLESYNLTMLFLYGGSAKSLNEAYSDIYTLGLLFNKTNIAVNLINEIESSFTETRRSIQASGLSDLKVLIVIDFWQGIWVVGKATFLDDVLSKLGLVNAASIYGWGVVNIEQIASWSPDLILVANMTNVSNETIKASGLYDLGKPVIVLNYTETDMLMRPGPLLIYAPKVINETLMRAFKTSNTAQSTTQIEHVSEKDLATLVIMVAFTALAFGLTGYYIGYRKGVKH